METIIATFIIFGLSFIGFGVGVLFFNKTPNSEIYRIVKDGLIQFLSYISIMIEKKDVSYFYYR